MDFREIAKTNAFIKHAAEIKAICYRDDCDTGVGAAKWRHENPGKFNLDTYQAELKEFNKLCREYTLNAIVDALGE